MGQSCSKSKKQAAQTQAHYINNTGITQQDSNTTANEKPQTHNINTQNNNNNRSSQFRHFSIKEEITFTQENIHDVYNFDPQIIGKGEFGEVRTASLKSCPKKKFAVKSICKDKIQNIQLIKNEVEILKGCDHPNIVKFYETYQDSKYLHLVMQYCRGGQLQIKNQQSRASQHGIKMQQSILKKSGTLYNYSENQVRDIMQKVFSCVKYIHHYGIVHRDLKLDNFVFMEKSETSCEIKLIDFGLSQKCQSKDSKMNALAGTYMYIAPEVLEQNGYTQACDDWSCGVMMYNLLSGEFPFYEPNTERLIKKIKSGEFKFKAEIWSKISKEAKDLIKKLLVVDYKKRITASDALKHPFFKQVNLDKYKREKNTNELQNLFEINVLPKLKFQAYKLCLGIMEEGELKSMRTEFRAFDMDDDGLISLEDLQNYQKHHKDVLKLSDEQLKEIIYKFTTNFEDKSYISYTGFLISSLDRLKKVTKKELSIIFSLLDVDNTGKVTQQNLIQALAREGRKLKQSDIAAIIEQVDFNQDNCISKIEFYSMMKFDHKEDMISDTKRKKSKRNSKLIKQLELKLPKTSLKYEDENISTSEIGDTSQAIDNIMLYYNVFYQKNIKNDGIPLQHKANAQPRIKQRKDSHKQEFDNDDFEQKLIDDEFMQNFDTTNTSQNQQEILKLMQRHSQTDQQIIPKNMDHFSRTPQNRKYSNIMCKQSSDPQHQRGSQGYIQLNKKNSDNNNISESQKLKNQIKEVQNDDSSDEGSSTSSSCSDIQQQQQQQQNNNNKNNNNTKYQESNYDDIKYQSPQKKKIQ